jgi:low affinity Fe/Cu permease
MNENYWKWLANSAFAVVLLLLGALIQHAYSDSKLADLSKEVVAHTAAPAHAGMLETLRNLEARLDAAIQRVEDRTLANTIEIKCDIKRLDDKVDRLLKR